MQEEIEDVSTDRNSRTGLVMWLLRGRHLAPTNSDNLSLVPRWSELSSDLYHSNPTPVKKSKKESKTSAQDVIDELIGVQR